MPTFLWIDQAYAQAPGIRSGSRPTGSGTAEEAAARAHLSAVALAYNLTDQDVRQARLRSVHNTGVGPIVLRTMFETDRLPAVWLPRLAEVDEIWVPCSFNLETFARGGVPPEKLHALPETLDFDLFSPIERSETNRPFTFLTNFDFTDRKGWDLLVEAWAEAFDPDDDVKLGETY